MIDIYGGVSGNLDNLWNNKNTFSEFQPFMRMLVKMISEMLKNFTFHVENYINRKHCEEKQKDKMKKLV